VVAGYQTISREIGEALAAAIVAGGRPRRERHGTALAAAAIARENDLNANLEREGHAWLGFDYSIERLVMPLK
jgi:hypothetical protein